MHRLPFLGMPAPPRVELPKCVGASYAERCRAAELRSKLHISGEFDAVLAGGTKGLCDSCYRGCLGDPVPGSFPLETLTGDDAAKGGGYSEPSKPAASTSKVAEKKAARILQEPGAAAYLHRTCSPKWTTF